MTAKNSTVWAIDKRILISLICAVTIGMATSVIENTAWRSDANARLNALEGGAKNVNSLPVDIAKIQVTQAYIINTLNRIEKHLYK